MKSFPAFHKTAERWVLSPYSVIYRWKGSGAAAKDDAVLFLAHYDVVAAETGKWSVDPFGAETKDGFIYGRGTLDMKAILVSLLEAAENLCLAGFVPKRDVWFAFGGDEERTGIRGGKEAAKWFTAREQRFSWLLDEGTPIGVDQIKGINSPLALVSMEEKGFMSLDLCVRQEPGHASRPPRTQATELLARALCRIAARPFPYSLTPTVENFFKQVSPLLHGINGFGMRHARALGPLFFKIAASTPTVASMLHTTVAMTQLEGSSADNVLPSEVRAVINIRLLQPWTVEAATDFIRKAVNDERVSITAHGMATGPVTAKNGFQNSGWKEIESALADAWPGIPILPFIMVATTDSRHFDDFTGGIYRFAPHKLNPKDLDGIHGHDERISEENLRQGLKFYTKLMGNL